MAWLGKEQVLSYQNPSSRYSIDSFAKVWTDEKFPARYRHIPRSDVYVQFKDMVTSRENVSKRLRLPLACGLYDNSVYLEPNINSKK